MRIEALKGILAAELQTWHLAEGNAAHYLQLLEPKPLDNSIGT